MTFGLQGLGRPRAGRAVAVVVALGLAFFAIARTTGAGWVVVLICCLLGCLAVALVAPLAALGKAVVAVVAPRDATVGQPSVFELAVTRGGAGLKVRVVDPPGEWVSADPPAAGEVVVRPTRRGVVEAVGVEVESGGPLGLVRWRRTMWVGLGAPLEIGPRPFDVSLNDVESRGSTGPSEGGRARIGHDLVRGVRDYAPGDAIRLVHWPATARWGRLMVRELEDPELPKLVVVVDLRGRPDRAEEVASRAAGLVADALAKGMRVTMMTAERGGGVVGEVASNLEAGRRLARAIPAAPPEGPMAAGSVVVRMGTSSTPPGLAASSALVEVLG